MTERQVAALAAETSELSLFRGQGQMLPYSAGGVGGSDDLADAELGRAQKVGQLMIAKGERREPVRDYIQNTRSILLAKIAMEDKEKEAQKMREYIDRKEASLNLNKEIYEQDKKMVNDYIDHIKKRADTQKEIADSKAKTRKDMEAQYEELKKDRTKIRKQLSDNKEECRSLKEYKNFIFSLKPDLKEALLQRKQKRRQNLFLTQQREGDEHARQPNPRPVDTNDDELREIREELELSEHDSDTELPTGFNTVKEMMELMEQKETKNFSLIKEARDRENSLERDKKEFEAEHSDKSQMVDQLKEELKELNEEEKRKTLRKDELMSKAISEGLSAPQVSKAAEPADLARLRELKNDIKEGLEDLYNRCRSNGAKALPPAGEAGASRKVTSHLEAITVYVIDLKKTREYKLLNAARTKPQDFKSLLDNERTDKEEMVKKYNEEGRREKEERDKQQKLKLMQKKNVPRFRKVGKEMVRRRMLQSEQSNKPNQNAHKAENTFDDIYFVD
jgi:hypothetical protein